MSVNSTDNKAIFVGDGSTDIFPYTFKIYAESDLIVERVTIATGAVATGVLDTHYTVSGEGTETGGNVTTIGAWENTSALYKIVIRRKLPLTQEIEFVDNVGTPAATYKEGFDRLCMICQSLQEQIDRSLLRDPTQTSAITFPGASADKLIGWNTAGTALENKETLDENVLASAAALLVDAQTAVTNAQTAATNSTNSANAAAISASEASAAQANLAAIIDTSTDLDGASASDAKVPSQLAVKTYADTKLAPNGDGSGLTGVLKGFGAWVDKSSSYGAQQASSDGFVVVRIYRSTSTNREIADGYTDSNSNPTTLRQSCDVVWTGNAQYPGQVSSFNMPVKKNDYWKVIITGSPTVTVYWIPLGS